jgi:hypothetical protein
MDTATTHLPAPMAIRELLADLLGREVSLTPAAPFAPGPANPATIAVYVDDSLVVRALVVVDLSLSAHTGAAIGLVPVGGAQAAVEDGALPDNLRDNLAEVLNIAASLFNTPGSLHLRLYDVHPAGGPLPPDLQVKALTLGRREDLAVDIATYGSGRFSIVLV